jgi:alcohol dehydrogenase (cytochrome c)
MYLVNGRWTVAVDIGTGRQIWRTAVEFEPAVVRAASTGVINRGAAIYNGKLYRATLDAQIMEAAVASVTRRCRTAGCN